MTAVLAFILAGLIAFSPVRMARARQVTQQAQNGGVMATFRWR